MFCTACINRSQICSYKFLLQSHESPSNYQNIEKVEQGCLVTKCKLPRIFYHFSQFLNFFVFFKDSSPMFSIIFGGSGVNFYSFFCSFSGQDRQETLGKNHGKNHGTRKFYANHPSSNSKIGQTLVNRLAKAEPLRINSQRLISENEFKFALVGLAAKCK